MDPVPLQRALRPLLAPLGRLYAMAMRARRSRIVPYEPPVPTVSVGNIAWGGTGKTPLTDELLSICSARGMRPCVLSRGYGARPARLPHLVSPTDDPAECGDEPLLLAKRHPRALVIVDPDRVRAARAAIAEHPDVIVLDDGFQHVAMGRHLDLLLLRPSDVGEEYDRVIPSGQWREGADALAKADAFLMKLDDRGIERIRPRIEMALARYGKPFFGFTMHPRPLRSIGNAAIPQDGRYVLVSGVGNPQDVHATAVGLLGAAPYRHVTFGDHHRYSRRDADSLTAYGMPVVCTAKDADKLARLDLPLWEMPVEVRFGTALWCDASSFKPWFNAWLDRHHEQKDTQRTPGQTPQAAR